MNKKKLLYSASLAVALIPARQANAMWCSLGTTSWSVSYLSGQGCGITLSAPTKSVLSTASYSTTGGGWYTNSFWVTYYSSTCVTLPNQSQCWQLWP